MNKDTKKELDKSLNWFCIWRRNDLDNENYPKEWEIKESGDLVGEGEYYKVKFFREEHKDILEAVLSDNSYQVLAKSSMTAYFEIPINNFIEEYNPFYDYEIHSSDTSDTDTQILSIYDKDGMLRQYECSSYIKLLGVDVNSDIIGKVLGKVKIWDKYGVAMNTLYTTQEANDHINETTKSWDMKPLDLWYEKSDNFPCLVKYDRDKLFICTGRCSIDKNSTSNKDFDQVILQGKDEPVYVKYVEFIEKLNYI